MTHGNKTASTPFWIDNFYIDPTALSVEGRFGPVSLEPKVMQVLVVLCSNPNKVVTRKLLMDQIWAVDYGSDESLTRAISLLRKHLGDTNGRRTVIETIPRRGYRLIGKVSLGPAKPNINTTGEFGKFGANPSLHPANTIKDLTSDTPAKSNGGLSLKLLRLSQNKKYLITALGILSLMIVSYRHLTLEPKTVTFSEQIQIDPFQVINDDKELQSFSTSLRSQMASVFLKNTILASFDQVESDETPKLRITGNLDKQGPNLRVTVNLIDAPTQMIIWSKAFDRPIDEITSFGDEITAKSANLIRCIQQIRSDTFSANADVLVLYANFCDSTSHTSMANILLLTEPIYLAEPNNLDAISLHAYALGRHSEWSEALTSEQRDTFMQKSRDLVGQISAQQPDAPFTQFLFASSTPMVGNWAEIEDKLLRATSENRMPDIVYMRYAFHLRLVGRIKEATQVYKDIVASNPVNADNITEFAWLHFTQNDTINSEKYFLLAERYDPKADILAIRRFQADVFFGSPDVALQRLADTPVEQWQPSTQNILCVKTFAEALTKETFNFINLQHACSNAPPHWLIRMSVSLGDLDQAFTLANELGFQNPGDTILLFYPDMAPFRADPRFWNIAKESGILDYWLETNKWPDFCGTNKLNVDCRVKAKEISLESLL